MPGRGPRPRARRSVAFRLCDYRAVNETFDRIVSVGMFEHVGMPNYGTFFRKINDCLKDNGVALLHTIGRLSGPGSTNPFIAKYIFPGGYTPALSEIVPAIEKSGLIVTDIEVLRLHYAKTLAAWRRNFEAAWDKAPKLVVRALLPDVAVLSCRRRGELPVSEHRGVPNPARKADRRGAAHPRLSVCA